MISDCYGARLALRAAVLSERPDLRSAEDRPNLRYANVTPSLLDCRQATRTSRISPLCPMMTVNVSGRPSASTTVSKAPKAERSPSVHETRFPLSVRICAEKLVAASRLSRRSWATVRSSEGVLTSDQYINDLADSWVGVLRRGWRSVLLNSHGYRLPGVTRHTLSARLQLRRAEHREVAVSRNANHVRRLHSAGLLLSRIKKRLKPNFVYYLVLINTKSETRRG